MSVFGNILNKIFHPGAARTATQPSTQTSPPASAPRPAPPPIADQQAAEPTAPSATSVTASVDVGSVLQAMADMKDDHGGNYKTSIVDLLKLLDLDSNFSARKELADELGVHAGEHGTAEQNIALHRAVMDKLAANGGIVPNDLRN